MGIPSTELPPHLGGQKTGNVDCGIIEAIRDDYGVKTLVDIGCGDGAAAKEYARLGMEVLGVDGDWTRLPQGDHRFVCHDFAEGPLDLGGFDLAYSVEFLEHLEERYLPNVMPIFAACKFAVVTAAPPGQPGHHHVNCREPKYWHGVFARHGLIYNARYTEHLRGVSTMGHATGDRKGEYKPFFKKTGMFFARG